jgi:hypothetical protein
MATHVITHKIIKKETKHMATHVITHKIIKKETKHMATHVITHKITCESQCTMTKWNPIIKLTPLNNYLSNCVITSSYTSNYMNTVYKAGVTN